MGIAPDAVLGQGVGELAAAAAAGILTPDEALKIIVDNGRGGVPSPRPAALPFLSSVDGKPHAGPDLDAAHWQTCLGQSHDLTTAAETLSDRRVDVFLQIGPQGPAASFSQLPDHPVAIVPSLLEGDQGRVDVLTAVGSLYAAGADFAWQSLAPPDGRCVRLPTYPWQRQRHWVEAKNWLSSPDAAKQSPDTSAAPEVRRRSELTVPYVAPQTSLEETLAESWSAVLRIDRVGVHDNFLELGGDSLQATILLNRLQDQLGEAVPGHMLFHAQTIDDLAKYLRQHFPDAVRRQHPDEVVADGDGHAAAQLSAIPRLARQQQAEDLLARLDELSDEEVESLLGEAAAESEASDE